MKASTCASLLVVGVLALSFAVATVDACVDETDCGSDQCCMRVGNQTATCKRLADYGEKCSVWLLPPSQQPYVDVCPCSSLPIFLACNFLSGICGTTL